MGEPFHKYGTKWFDCKKSALQDGFDRLNTLVCWKRSEREDPVFGAYLYENHAQQKLSKARGAFEYLNLYDEMEKMMHEYFKNRDAAKEESKTWSSKDLGESSSQIPVKSNNAATSKDLERSSSQIPVKGNNAATSQVLESFSSQIPVKCQNTMNEQSKTSSSKDLGESSSQIPVKSQNILEKQSKTLSSKDLESFSSQIPVKSNNIMKIPTSKAVEGSWSQIPVKSQTAEISTTNLIARKSQQEKSTLNGPSPQSVTSLHHPQEQLSGVKKTSKLLAHQNPHACVEKEKLERQGKYFGGLACAVAEINRRENQRCSLINEERASRIGLPTDGSSHCAIIRSSQSIENSKLGEEILKNDSYDSKNEKPRIEANLKSPVDQTKKIDLQAILKSTIDQKKIDSQANLKSTVDQTRKIDLQATLKSTIDQKKIDLQAKTKSTIDQTKKIKSTIDQLKKIDPQATLKSPVDQTKKIDLQATLKSTIDQKKIDLQAKTKSSNSKDLSLVAATRKTDVTTEQTHEDSSNEAFQLVSCSSFDAKISEFASIAEIVDSIGRGDIGLVKVLAFKMHEEMIVTELLGQGAGYIWSAHSKVWSYARGHQMKEKMVIVLELVINECCGYLAATNNKNLWCILEKVQKDATSLKFLDRLWSWLFHRLYREVKWNSKTHKWYPLNDGHSINLKDGSIQETRRDYYFTNYLDVASHEVDTSVEARTKLRGMISNVKVDQVKQEAVGVRFDSILPLTMERESSQMPKDPLDVFLEQTMEITDDEASKVSFHKIYHRYRKWCLKSQYPPQTNISVSKSLQKRGLEKIREGGVIKFKAVSLLRRSQQKM